MTAVVFGVRGTSVYQWFRVPSQCARLLLFAAQGPRYFPRYNSRRIRGLAVSPGADLAHATAPETGRDARVTTQTTTQRPRGHSEREARSGNCPVWPHPQAWAPILRRSLTIKILASDVTLCSILRRTCAPR
jgi:hypothetical protein